jgi:hypothetical protein
MRGVDGRREEEMHTLPVTHFHSLLGGSGVIFKTPLQLKVNENFPSCPGFTVQGITTYVFDGEKVTSNSTTF